MQDGFLRVATATIKLRVADVHFNSEQIISHIVSAGRRDVSLVVFPELTLTGATCADLFFDQNLQLAAWAGLEKILSSTKDCPTVGVIGLPVVWHNQLYNAAAVIQSGRCLGFVPKTVRADLPLHQSRHFACGRKVPAGQYLTVAGTQVPFGSNLIFSSAVHPDFSFFVESGEDLWSITSQAPAALAAGANILVNPAAAAETVSGRERRRSYLSNLSTRLSACCLLANAGPDESTTDLVFSGQRLILENGKVIAESEPYRDGLTVADIDLNLIRIERSRNLDYRLLDPAPMPPVISFEHPFKKLDLEREIRQTPFVPAHSLTERCREILAIQTYGLVKRLSHLNLPRPVIGLSGGLDSTLALLVAVSACQKLALPSDSIQAVLMPGPGSSERTKNNALTLATKLAVSILTIDISAALAGHLEDIGHDGTTFDIVYENAQARERTQILMDLANQGNGIVIGTGDLSEAALGWETYGGDHLSMYNVNCSIPKTLIPHLIRQWAKDNAPDSLPVLVDIIKTPASPELQPAVAGETHQITEDLLGPYLLHDFFLYYFVRYGFTPAKILRLADKAFAGQYSAGKIKDCLDVFLRRIVTQQFKRSCSPDGPAVGSVTLSPRSGWTIPSDAKSAVWQDLT